MSDNPDLAYLRSVAESGERAAPLGGRFFLWWGGLASIALLAHWFVISGHAGILPAYVGFVWMVYGVVGLAGSFVLARTLTGKPGRGAVNNRGESAVWQGMVWLVAAYAIGAVVAMFLGRGHALLFDTIPLVAFGGYGVSYWVTARLGGPRWMTALAIVSWLASGIGLSLVGTAELYLFAAAMVSVLAVVPGIVLLRGEPAAEPG
ncbi:hypothetical protein [Maricaulis sp.]|uniref:hypothetical protein n=1 Tax=Maricaulis sp. TaxID=1486257 RepID=UPI0026267306|nr:hypothetical protein [Maricaulis sp.]